VATVHVTSNGPDWKDLAEMIATFEEQNTVTIEISVRRCNTGGEPDLSLTATAWQPNIDRRVVKPLALKNVKCRAEKFKRVESALSFLLYQLDFQLAEHEWLNAGRKG